MSFGRYPAYKASSLPWLGEVPAHWKVTQLKRLVDPDRQITYGIVQAGPHIPDGIPYIRPADMTDEMGIETPDEVMRTSTEIASGYSRSTIRTGDLVCSIGPSFGKAMITPTWLDGANLTQGTARIAVHPPHVGRYLFWVLRSPLSVAQWDSSVGGATFRALNLGPLAETSIPVPPESEQTRIAAFLDRETAKIDGLVAEQQRLIDLLKEKRQAVISHAVTKGLNPTAPMKSSGIEWLGDVPDGWVVPYLGRIIARADLGGNYEASESETGIPLIKMGNLGRGVIYSEQVERLPEEADYDHSFRLEKGDFLFNTRNSLDLVGKVAIWRNELPVAIYNSNILRIRFKKQMVETTAYANYFFNSDLGISQLRAIAKGTTSVAAVYHKDLITMRIILPPSVEQASIVAYLDDRCAEIDALTAEAQRAIDLLQERRTAVISAAVTGQIDVRHLAEASAA